MRERAAFEAEVGLLLGGGREFDQQQPAARATNILVAGVDAAAAIPPFSARLRARIDGGLTAEARKRAVKLNAGTPLKTGVTAAVLRAALQSYVDFGKLPRTSDDEKLAEAVYQFQRKCFARSDAWDGQAGEATLDALGFVRRPKRKLELVDVTNTSAKKVVTEAIKNFRTEFEAELPGVSANTWFEHMVSAPFLGHKFQDGIHLLLLRKLRTAERHLATLAQYRDRTPVELGRLLDVEELHKGARPTKTSGSMHTFGLGFDLNYLANPWVGGNPDRPSGNTVFANVTGRSSLLVNGASAPLTAAVLDALGTDASLDTGQVYDSVRARSDELVAYFDLLHQPQRLLTCLQRRRADRTPLVFKLKETDAAAAQRWTEAIKGDLAAMRGYFGTERDPRRGFMTLSRDLVVALRESGCLAWGGVDFGSRASGDMMHFDNRAEGLGKRIQPPQRHEVTQGHPCLTGKRTTGMRGIVRPRKLGQERHAFGDTLYVEIALGGEGEARPMTALFVPDGFKVGAELDAVVWFHGYKKKHPGNDTSIDDYLNYTRETYFQLRESVHSSRRNVVFIAPTLGNKAQYGRLGDPGMFDLYLHRCLCALRLLPAFAKTPLALRSLILAAHSGGDGPMRKIAQLAEESVERLRECWGFDSSYGGTSEWIDWSRRHPSRALWVYAIDKTDTAPWAKTLSRAARPNIHVHEEQSTVNHFDVPRMHLVERLQAASFLTNR